MYETNMIIMANRCFFRSTIKSKEQTTWGQCQEAVFWSKTSLWVPNYQNKSLERVQKVVQKRDLLDSMKDDSRHHFRRRRLVLFLFWYLRKEMTW